MNASFHPYYSFLRADSIFHNCENAANQMIHFATVRISQPALKLQHLLKLMSLIFLKDISLDSDRGIIVLLLLYL